MKSGQTYIDLYLAHYATSALGFARGVSRFAVERGNLRCICHSIEWLDVAERLPRSRTGARGVIAEFRGPRDVPLATRTGDPVVSICDLPAACECPCVVVDEERVGQIVAQRFLQLGFRRFAFLGTDVSWSRRRERAFGETIEAAGFSCRSRFPGDGLDTSDTWQIYSPEFSLRSWVANLTPPHAVMTCNSSMAVRLIEACGDAGLRVPADVAIIGVDDDELTCEYAPVSITAVDTDWQRIGYEAARVLEMMLRGKKPPRRVVVPPRGVSLRNSSDTVPVGTRDVAKALRYIRAHADEAIDVRRLADRVGVSRRTLERKFKQELKCSPAEEILRTRLSRVANLLVATDESLYAIAAQCGFAFRSHLSRSFTDFFGQSPSDYRAQHRKLTVH